MFSMKNFWPEIRREHLFDNLKQLMKDIQTE